MAHAATCDAAALQDELLEHLREIDHAGDAERIAQRLARKHSRGSHVVGFRRRGEEVLLHEDRADGGALRIYEVGVDGQLLRAGTLWNGRDLEGWVERHHHFLEWVRPDLRPAATVNRTLSSFAGDSDGV